MDCDDTWLWFALKQDALMSTLSSTRLGVTPILWNDDTAIICVTANLMILLTDHRDFFFVASTSCLPHWLMPAALVTSMAGRPFPADCGRIYALPITDSVVETRIERPLITERTRIGAPHAAPHGACNCLSTQTRCCHMWAKPLLLLRLSVQSLAAISILCLVTVWFPFSRNRGMLQAS